MPSFTRRVPTTVTPPPPGTIPSLSAATPPLYLLPTGIPSIDDLLAGGIPLGGIYLITTPDKHTQWSRLISRYWISQGLITGQKNVIVGPGEDVKEVVRGSMWVDERSRGSGSGGGEGDAGSESETEGLGEDDGGKTKIAWRYERMKKFQTTVSQGGSTELNLMSTIPSEFLDHLEKTGVQRYIPLEGLGDGQGPSNRSAGWRILSSVLGRLHDLISSHEQGTALRITIHELGSLDWGHPSSQEIHRFLHSLKCLIGTKPIGLLVTLPASLASSSPSGETLEEWTNKLSWDVDALIEIRGFGDEPTLPPLYHPLHGLLTIPTFPTTHHLLPPTLKHSSLLGLSAGSSGGGGAGENNLGFRLKRKRFVVETVHLGIEGGTGERRTAPAEEVGRMISAPAPSSEGVEGVERASNSIQTSAGQEGGGGVERPTGPVEEKEKKKKPRARVRFGGEEELAPPPELGAKAQVRFGGEEEVLPPPEITVQVGGKGRDGEEDHGHHHHGQGHHHDHGHSARSQQPRKPMVRHDRPDLYEF